DKWGAALWGGEPQDTGRHGLGAKVQKTRAISPSPTANSASIYKKEQTPESELFGVFIYGQKAERDRFRQAAGYPGPAYFPQRFADRFSRLGRSGRRRSFVLRV